MVTTVVTVTGHRFLSCYACPVPILINKLCAVPVTCIYVPTKSQALPLYCTCLCSLQLAARDAHCSSCHQRKLPQNNSYIHSRKQLSKLGDFAIWEDWRQCSRTSQRHTSCSPELKQPQKILLFGSAVRVCGLSRTLLNPSIYSTLSSFSPTCSGWVLAPCPSLPILGIPTPLVLESKWPHGTYNISRQT